MKTKWTFFIIGLFLTGTLAFAQDSPGSMTLSDDDRGTRIALKPDQALSFCPIQPVPKAVSPAEANPLPVRHIWGDVDEDGLKDLFVLDLEGNLLFHNLGDGGFEEVTLLAFPDGAGCGVSGFFGDYNGDDKPDLFLFHSEGFSLFENRGKLLFTDVTETLGLDQKLPPGAVQLEDFDRDGFNDLLVQTPDGDRVFRNNGGRDFGEVVLTTAERRKDGTWGSGTVVTGPIPPVQSPGGPAAPHAGMDGSLSWDGLYLNDNSPDSVGIGCPEVEGGDDGTIPNDIVDETITGSDVKYG